MGLRCRYGKSQLEFVDKLTINIVMAEICANCGAKTGDHTVLSRDQWNLWPQFATLRGRNPHLTAAEANILHTLAGAEGGVVAAETIGRGFSESDCCTKSVRVIITRLRKKLGKDCPIETIHGQGYRWRDGP